MFGLEFLFGAAFWALPLAGLPVLLHMLFRRKSPVVPFSTLRFIKASIQQTAARRRIQRWVLLACRVLLLLLLIWAISQPVLILASGWFAPGQSIVAAIVVDTSYSMQIKQNELRQLDRANDIIAELLREPLKEGKSAIFRSQPPADGPEQLRTAAEIQSQWRALEPEPSGKPLADRVLAAADFLSRQQAGQKWLIVLTDLQSREFPAPLPPLEDARVILFDLHPDKPTSHGITSVRMEPEQPIPGIGSQAAIEVTGQTGDAPFLNLDVTKLDGMPLKSIPNLQATFDAAGRTQVRAPLKDGLPVERYLLVKAQLQREDDLEWDNARAHLVELPPRQNVTFIEAPGQPAASSFIRLALDPWEGKVAGWPLQVTPQKDFSGNEQVVVVALSEWPDALRANRMVRFARGGGTLILLLQPGLEQAWAHQGPKQKEALLQLLPADLAPTLPGGGSAGATGVFRPLAPPTPDRVLEGLTDPTFRLDLLTVRRFVPFTSPTDPNVSVILPLAHASDGGRSASRFGLLYRRSVGSGTVFTMSTLPEGRYISPPAHPLFLPLLVSMSLRPPEQRDVQNIEIGQSLTLSGARYAMHGELEVECPDGARYRVKPLGEGDERRFSFDKTIGPGLYYWRKPGETAMVAIGNAQLPSAESDLIYKAADAVVTPGPDCLVFRDFAEFKSNVAEINQPQPKWSVPLALVLMLMCAEALLASMSQLWKPVSWRSILPWRG